MSGILSMIRSLLGPADPSQHLGPEEAHQKLKDNRSLQLVDVRTKEEYQEVRIPGSRLIPLHELGSRSKEMDKTKPILLYCRSGNRSGAALHQLKSKGFTQVAHIRGGIIGWMNRGLPVEPKK